MKMVFFMLLCLFAEFVDGFEEAGHVVGVQPVQVVDIALLVDELVGGVAVDADVVLDGGLLVFRQVVVHAVGTRQVVLLDDISPRLVAAAVSQRLQGPHHVPQMSR